MVPLRRDALNHGSAGTVEDFRNGLNNRIGVRHVHRGSRARLQHGVGAQPVTPNPLQGQLPACGLQVPLMSNVGRHENSLTVGTGGPAILSPWRSAKSCECSKPMVGTWL